MKLSAFIGALCIFFHLLTIYTDTKGCDTTKLICTLDSMNAQNAYHTNMRHEERNAGIWGICLYVSFFATSKIVQWIMIYLNYDQYNTKPLNSITPVQPADTPASLSLTDEQQEY